MQRNSVDEYVGISGGFTVDAGRYTGSVHSDIDLRSSGQFVVRSDNAGIHVAASGDIDFDTPQSVVQFSSDGTIKHAAKALDVDLSDGPWDVQVSGNTNLRSLGPCYVSCITQPLELAGQGIALRTYHTNGLDETFLGSISGIASEELFLASSGLAVVRSDYNDVAIVSYQQTNLSPFMGSGQLEYRFGPYEAWHISPGHTADFFPLAHSGQVMQMIAEQSTLQTAYEANEKLNINAIPGNFTITAVGAKPVFGTTSTFSEMNLSGVLTLPSSDHEVGDIFCSRHESVVVDPLVGTLAEAQAASLGHGMLAYNTGSGIAGLSVCSGIRQCINTAVSTLNSAAVKNFAWNTTHANAVWDARFCVQHTRADIHVMTPGIYRISYHIAFDVTSIGSADSTIRAYVYSNPASASPTNFIIGRSYIVLSQASAATAAGERSMSASFYKSLGAGDTLQLRWIFHSAQNGWVVSSITAQSFMTVEYMSPTR